LAAGLTVFPGFIANQTNPAVLMLGIAAAVLGRL
jgi:hypothetical protein